MKKQQTIAIIALFAVIGAVVYFSTNDQSTIFLKKHAHFQKQQTHDGIIVSAQVLSAHQWCNKESIPGCQKVDQTLCDAAITKYEECVKAGTDEHITIVAQQCATQVVVDTKIKEAFNKVTQCQYEFYLKVGAERIAFLLATLFLMIFLII